MTIHKNANGKTACRLDVEKKQVELSDKRYKVLIQFNENGTADVINYDLNGKKEVYHYLGEE
jgi:hypothetical protein